MDCDKAGNDSPGKEKESASRGWGGAPPTPGGGSKGLTAERSNPAQNWEVILFSVWAANGLGGGGKPGPPPGPWVWEAAAAAKENAGWEGQDVWLDSPPRLVTPSAGIGETLGGEAQPLDFKRSDSSPPDSLLSRDRSPPPELLFSSPVISPGLPGPSPSMSSSLSLSDSRPPPRPPWARPPSPKPYPWFLK